MSDLRLVEWISSLRDAIAMSNGISKENTKIEAHHSFFLGTAKAYQSPVELPACAFQRHFMALGGSSSGKTVLCKCVIEEAVRNSIPVLIIDPQGDISSFATRADLGELQEHGTSPEVQEEFFSKARIAIFTSASRKAIPISINPFRSPSQEIAAEEAVQAIDITATSLASFSVTISTQTPEKRARHIKLPRT